MQIQRTLFMNRFWSKYHKISTEQTSMDHFNGQAWELYNRRFDQFMDLRAHLSHQEP